MDEHYDCCTASNGQNTVDQSDRMSKRQGGSKQNARQGWNARYYATLSQERRDVYRRKRCDTLARRLGILTEAELKQVGMLQTGFDRAPAQTRQQMPS
jgi:hypothetical protein